MSGMNSCQKCIKLLDSTKLHTSYAVYLKYNIYVDALLTACILHVSLLQRVV